MNNVVIPITFRISILDNVWKHKANTDFFLGIRKSNLLSDMLLLMRLVFCRNVLGPLLIIRSQ